MEDVLDYYVIPVSEHLQIKYTNIYTYICAYTQIYAHMHKHTVIYTKKTNLAQSERVIPDIQYISGDEIGEHNFIC